MSNVSEPSARASRQAEYIVAMPEAVSFIVEVAGQPFGHATLLMNQVDDTTDEVFAEFSTCWCSRRTRSGVRQRPFFSRSPKSSPVGRTKLLERLRTQGWTFSHKFMISRDR